MITSQSFKAQEAEWTYSELESCIEALLKLKIWLAETATFEADMSIPVNKLFIQINFNVSVLSFTWLLLFL